MSRRPSEQSTSAAPRPVRQGAGGVPLESLSRWDVEDDPDHGSSLYDAVARQDTTALSADGWLDRLEAITRIEARLDALKAEAVAGFDDSLHGVSADLGHRYPQPGDRAATAGERRWIAGDLRSVSDEIALTLNLRRGHATTRIHQSCELVHNFPATWYALREGLLTERAAFTIVSELSLLEDLDDLHAAEAAVLDWASTHPLVDIKKACRDEAARRSPEATDKAYQRDHDERSVRMYTDDFGRADLVHGHDVVDATAVMASLSRAAAYRRRQGDSRTTDQLRNDIALERLLPRTKSAHRSPAFDESAGSTIHAPAVGEPASGTTREPVFDEPVGDANRDPAGHGETGNQPPTWGDPDPEARPLVDAQCPVEAPASSHAEAEDRAQAGAGAHAGVGVQADAGSHADADADAAVGAEATVVIHATGAEVLALINGEAATGGDVDHYGPIPQRALRKHLVKALTRTLLPNLPTTPNSPRPGAVIHRARVADATAGTAPATEPAPTPGCTSAPAPSPEPAPASGSSASLHGDSRIELQITDRPPPSNPDRYTPSPALDRYVRLRDRTCQFPGCNRPAEYTDVDHRTAFAAGGRTTATNLWCLCRHHHRLKHEGGWHTHPNPDGAYTWTSPTGRQYNNNPAVPQPPPDPAVPQSRGSTGEAG